MKRHLGTSWSWGLIVAVVGLVPLAGPSYASTAETPLYAKQNTWSQSMLAARANYLRYIAQQQVQKENPAAKPFVSAPACDAAPAQHVEVNVAGVRSLRLLTTIERGPGNCNIWGEARLIARDGGETPAVAMTL